MTDYLDRLILDPRDIDLARSPLFVVREHEVAGA